MKNIVKLTLLLVLVGVIGFTGFACSCKKTDPVKQNLLIVAPDGAPALALSNLMVNNENFDNNVTYEIVDAQTLPNYIPNQKADIAIIPINSATMWCNSNYKIVAVNTHGNLYIMGKTEISGLNDIVGKKLGCIQYQNVPGLTLRAILNGKGIDYQPIGGADDETDANKINIIAYDAPAVAVQAINQGMIDYAIIAEPAASLMAKNFQAQGLKIVGDIQEYYEEVFHEELVQAVTVVKTELINNNPELVNKILNKMAENDTFLKAENISAILEAINAHTTEGFASSLNANNLTQNSINGSNVKFVDAITLKDAIKNYINRVKQVDSDSPKIRDITDDIFYTRTK